ncbi:hypothetical protein TraAM80_05052 [Trypanosoma rangeli]|uniref:Uncharacterized protein n=1 Tax=Trypanosoma rangeli TaxID=5698 RepID=A0A422NGX7_TRYRA|nr:uncharacterized protein TraAM80_05052 [Trypanosoma rangeli]RNF04718.1 hypothetical protein TraAM80_05052 [Trypanosoma rangeli]|eukprot:RNF04718.1 hypothetical protein TraAM80_05052 [Trypanosoma rangeli]
MTSGGGSTASAGAESTANETTRNFILGFPKEGPAPGSADAASLQEAEVFLGEIQQEIMAYDLANARAMETYARSCWEKIPFFGKRWAVAAASDVEGCSKPLDSHGNAHGDTATVAAATHTMQGKYRVERTSADAVGGATRTPQPKMNSWLFKQRHPGWVPLIQRWWVPCVCVAGLVVIWTPDVWKLRTLYWCDHKYALLRQSVHRAYWRATMCAADYEQLMQELGQSQPRSVKATKCPL